MASLKDIKQNIHAVEQTQKLTNAMNMVAASKLRSVQSKAEQFSSFATAYENLVNELVKRISDSDNLLMKPTSGSNKVAIIAFSSDRGLCGAFNYNVFRALDRELKKLKEENTETELILIGRKLYDYYKKRPVQIKDSYIGILNDFNFTTANEISDSIIALYLSGEYKEIKIIFTEFYRITSFKPVMKPVLPMTAENLHQNQEKQNKTSNKNNEETSVTEKDAQSREYLIEPSSSYLLKKLLPKSLSILIYKSMLDSSTSENAARMQAMDNAYENCTEMIGELTLLYNKARQTAVTTELLDIIGGAEALTN